MCPDRDWRAVCRHFWAKRFGPRCRGMCHGKSRAAAAVTGQRPHLPGVIPEDVDLTVERNVVSIRAERHPAPHDGDEVIVDERS